MVNGMTAKSYEKVEAVAFIGKEKARSFNFAAAEAVAFKGKKSTSWPLTNMPKEATAVGRAG